MALEAEGGRVKSHTTLHGMPRCIEEGNLCQLLDEGDLQQAR